LPALREASDWPLRGVFRGLSEHEGTEDVTKEEFVEQTAELIEGAIRRSQGFGDYRGRERSPEEIAGDIASLMPEYIWDEPATLKRGEDG
jgi:hypothetical protein